MKHQYADYVQAFIEGKPVQCRSGSPDGDWFDMTALTQFDCYYDFRLKPSEKVVRWLWVYQESHNNQLVTYIGANYMTEEEAAQKRQVQPLKKLEWSRQEFDE